MFPIFRTEKVNICLKHEKSKKTQKVKWLFPYIDVNFLLSQTKGNKGRTCKSVLQVLVMAYLKTIESNAFENCVALEEL